MLALKDDIRTTTILKGIAILGVIFLHTLSSVHNLYATIYTGNFWLVVADQAARFCVPLFIALSGYALMSKYADKLTLSSFFWRRVMRLLPLYILWTVVLSVAIGHTLHFDLLNKLLLGYGDYQLYFVPMIIQLYLLFPILRFGMLKNKNLFLICLLIVQLVTLFLYSPFMAGAGGWIAALRNNYQYLFSFSWIFYFGLGMRLSLEKGMPKFHIGFFGLKTLVGLTLCVISGFVLVGRGYDTINALRFTRFPIVLYASGFIGVSIAVRAQLLKIQSTVRHVLEFLGEQSYLIYLCHTLLLRIIFSATYRDTSLPNIAFQSLLFVVGLIASFFVQKI
ncbi:MAG TPA: acyltransferase [Patescibacteria group bacterium]|nr:acyltransferase [Patescibacteria group bacterium]